MKRAYSDLYWQIIQVLLQKMHKKIIIAVYKTSMLTLYIKIFKNTIFKCWFLIFPFQLYFSTLFLKLFSIIVIVSNKISQFHWELAIHLN